MSLLYKWLQSAVSERADPSETAGANALVYRDTYISWRGLLHRVDRRAQDLRSLGVGPGSWVGLMLGNVPDFVIIALALSKLRAVVVPIDPTTSSRDLDMILEATPLRALITRPHGTDSLAAPVNTLRIEKRPAPQRFAPESRRRLQGTLLTASLYRRETPPAPAKNPPSVVLFTLDGGGDPKGVVRGDDQLAAVADVVGQTLDLRSGERTLCITPLYRSYGFDTGLLGCLAHRTTLILDDDTVVPKLSKLLLEQSVDVLPGTPAAFAAMARSPTARPLRLRAARFISSGAPLQPGVAESFQTRFGVRLLSCYHTTETGPVTIDREGKHPLTVGKPFEGVEVRVAAANGAPLPTATPGPVWVRGAGVSGDFIPKLALKPRDGVAPVGRADAEGWFRTGDLGYFDKNGRLALTGREDDLVKVDGRRLALGEVEGCLEAFANVRAAQARVEYDDFGDPRVVAKVVRSGRVRVEEIIDHCARNLAPYKVPHHIEFAEALDDDAATPAGPRSDTP